MLGLDASTTRPRVLIAVLTREVSQPADRDEAGNPMWVAGFGSIVEPVVT
jgi:hypothetical protein